MLVFLNDSYAKAFGANATSEKMSLFWNIILALSVPLFLNSCSYRYPIDPYPAYDSVLAKNAVYETRMPCRVKDGDRLIWLTDRQFYLLLNSACADEAVMKGTRIRILRYEYARMSNVGDFLIPIGKVLDGKNEGKVLSLKFVSKFNGEVNFRGRHPSLYGEGGDILRISE